ncbi:MAG: MraY family glycosyltransferase [Alistipes sp.]
MNSFLVIFAPVLLACVAVSAIHPYIVKIAILKDIVDHPNERKLQKSPVPILGGVAVFFGICLSMACLCWLCDCEALFVIFSGIMVMLYMGVMDDILDLSPRLRFVVQILTICLLIFIGGFGLDNLHGLWGVEALPFWAVVPLTIFAGVGIINALNLIDGVNGLSTGYCMMAAATFGAVFYLGGGNQTITILAMAVIGSLLPFFLHNVFGNESKMFIGDGGTLVMGLVMSVFVMKIVQSEGVTQLLDGQGFSSIAFTLAVLAIPVFDTLRVMSTRILRGQSPFQPDKTHLHHLFIELGCSHIMTTLTILLLNICIIVLWWLLGHMGASFEVQVFGVALAALLCTTGVYATFRVIQRSSPATFEAIKQFTHKVRVSREGTFLTLQKWIDKI